jgi:hypothetical protein
MKKAVIFTLLGLVLLFGVSLVASFYMFQRYDRILAEQPGDPQPPPGQMSWKSYKKIRLALGSFDLVNGLTKNDLDTMHAGNHEGFYYLIGCLWLVLGLRFGLRRPRSKAKSGAEGAG